MAFQLAVFDKFEPKQGSWSSQISSIDRFEQLAAAAPTAEQAGAMGDGDGGSRSGGDSTLSNHGGGGGGSGGEEVVGGGAVLASTLSRALAVVVLSVMSSTQMLLVAGSESHNRVADAGSAAHNHDAAQGSSSSARNNGTDAASDGVSSRQCTKCSHLSQPDTRCVCLPPGTLWCSSIQPLCHYITG